jgi:hypothetical protein
MEKNQERLKALEAVAQAARKLEKLLSGTNHPGIDDEKNLLLGELKKAVHCLDEVEGNRDPIGKTEKWEE